MGILDSITKRMTSALVNPSFQRTWSLLNASVSASYLTFRQSS